MQCAAVFRQAGRTVREKAAANILPAVPLNLRQDAISVGTEWATLLPGRTEPPPPTHIVRQTRLGQFQYESGSDCSAGQQGGQTPVPANDVDIVRVTAELCGQLQQPGSPAAMQHTALVQGSADHSPSYSSRVVKIVQIQTPFKYFSCILIFILIWNI